MSQTASARPDSRSRLAVPLFLFSLAAIGAGAGRALTTTYLPVLLERIQDAPHLIGAVMTVNAIAGFAVPIAVGLWSDRRGRRLPFMVGGALLSGGGLVAVGFGNGSSYLVLALSAGLVYTGLNALTTAHRAIVAEDVEDRRRPAATSAQEIAGLAGAVLAVAIGGALIEPAPTAAFALTAGVLAASAVPTLLLTRRLRLGEHAAPASGPRERPRVREVLRHPGAREVLLAQTMWVFGYAALPAFFVLYAEESLGLELAAAGALPLAFGALTAAGDGGCRTRAARACPRPADGGRRAARRRAARRRARHQPARGRPGPGAGRAGRGPGDRARLPVLRALGARGEGGRIQRRVLRRPSGGGGRRVAAGGPGGGAERRLPQHPRVRRGGAGRARPACARQAPHRAGPVPRCSARPRPLSPP